MVPVIQGKKTLSQPMKALGADLENNLIVYNNNPVDKWCLCNTAVDVDKNDNIQPIKGSKPRRRIDGTAALLDAYVVLQNNMNDYMSLIWRLYRALFLWPDLRRRKRKEYKKWIWEKGLINLKQI